MLIRAVSQSFYISLCIIGEYLQVFHATDFISSTVECLKSQYKSITYRLQLIMFTINYIYN